MILDDWDAVRGDDGHHHLLLQDSRVYRHAVRAVPGTRRGVCPDDRSISIKHPFYTQVSKWVYIFPDKGRFTFAAGAFIAVLVAGIFLAHFTRFGRNVYAIGGNDTGAVMLGVPVGRTIISVYALSSFLATFAGIVLSLSKRSGDSTIAVDSELDVIAAVVIGGTLLTGGVGYVIGTFIGVLI